MSTRIAQGLPTNPRSIVGGRATPSRQFEAPRPQSRPSAIPSNPRPRTPSSHRGDRRPAPEPRERVPRLPQQRIPHDHEGRRCSDESVSTSSSNDSSYWPRGQTSQSSSRTTLQSDRDDYDDPPRETCAKEPQAVNNYIDTGFVWGRVTEAANVITQEVSKVWAAGLTSSAENDDTEGESHLIRVMRAYHLSKARTPSELPNWLFNERERGQGGLLRFDKPDSHGDGSQMKNVPAQQVQRRNRPTHGDNTAPLGTQLRIDRDAQNPKPLVPQAKLSGSDRLKQMRDLRRNAPSSAF